MKKLILWILGVVCSVASVVVVTKKILIANKYKEVHLKVFGVAIMADGIGRQAVELMQALKEDVSIAYFPVRATDPTDIPQDVLKIIKANGRKNRSKVAILVDAFQMPGYRPWKRVIRRTSSEQIRIAYSMLESTKIPPDWATTMNRHFDAIVVPDRFLIDVYKNSGVEIPVFELPLGLYLDGFFEEPLRSASKKPMVFGYLSSCLERKNHIKLIQGFAKAFGNRADVRLKINYRYGQEHVINKIREEIASLGLENVEFTDLRLDNPAYLQYFKTLDCYISPSKGEGFSIQPREAMALGIPAIVTNNTAQTTICNSGYVRVIPSNIEEPALYWWGEVCGEHYDCEVDDVADALLDVFHNYQDYLQKTVGAREWVHNYEFKNLKQRYLNLVKPKKIIFGESNEITNDYLMTNSKTLYDKYKKL
jgi:glycosyltransferase involved in cell wall biosynthesis